MIKQEMVALNRIIILIVYFSNRCFDVNANKYILTIIILKFKQMTNIIRCSRKKAYICKRIRGRKTWGVNLMDRPGRNVSIKL